jgi:phosphoserine phosphatase
MDSTLIQGEVIDKLAQTHGVGQQVAEITESAMNGELDFKQSLIQRTSLLKGLDEGVLSETADNLVLNDGVRNLTRSLKKLGYKIGIISGGFDYFGKYLQNELKLDYVFANELEVSGSKVTGKIKGDIIDGPKKAEILKTIAMVENINLQQTIGR